MEKRQGFTNLYVSTHPVVQHKLTLMRDKNCSKPLFRQLLREISMMMGYAVTHKLPVVEKEIETPLTKMKAPVLAGENPVIVSILRAGLGLSDGLEIVMPNAYIGHIGLYRDEETKRPVEYLVKLPEVKGRKFFVCDPMLATGHSAEYALDLLVKRGARPEDITMMVLVAAPEGVRVVNDAFPEIDIYTAALDSHLNEKAYIVPGLGDAGDRLFGTM